MNVAHEHALQRVHLQIIVEVERQGSLTAAADALSLTQSALSHSIKKLEKQLGLTIWVRDGRRLHLTSAGRYLLSLGERLLPQLSVAEMHLTQFATGVRGTLRVGMECHPCYQWLLRVTEPYLRSYLDVDIDVIQKFQFGGLDALINHEIDVLVTPDPVLKKGLHFQPVFDYEQVLVVCANHPLTSQSWVKPQDLKDEVLFSYPVSLERLDIYRSFFTPAGLAPACHKRVETTDMILQMVACGRGVTALPRWLAEGYAESMDLVVLRLGEDGIAKQIHLGLRDESLRCDYIAGFVREAQTSRSALSTD